MKTRTDTLKGKPGTRNHRIYWKAPLLAISLTVAVVAWLGRDLHRIPLQPGESKSIVERSVQLNPKGSPKKVELSDYESPEDVLAAMQPIFADKGLTLPAATGDHGLGVDSIPPEMFYISPSSIPSEDGSLAFAATNPAQGFQARFSKGKGIEVRPAGIEERDAFDPHAPPREPLEKYSLQEHSLPGDNDWRWALQVNGIGYGTEIEDLPESDPVAEGDVVSFQRGAVTEWYRNQGEGLEQGFHLKARPDGAQNEQLHLAMAIKTTLRGLLNSDGSAIEFLDERGEPRLLLDRLVVTDANGTPVESSFKAEPNQVNEDTFAFAFAIAMNDSDAVYPLMVDPILSQPIYHFDENNDSSYPQQYYGELNGEFYFGASTQGTGYELWKTDGSTAGTVLVKDIYQGSGSSYPGNHSRGFYPLGGELFFSAYGSDATTGTTSGYELWKTDGTTAGTVLVNDIYQGSGSSSPGNHSRGFYPLGGELFFSANGYDATTGTSSGYELWKTDGSTAGTVLVNDIYQGSGSSVPGNNSQGFYDLGGELFFSAYGYDATTGTTSGYELWKTDGSTAGTVLVNDISEGSGSSYPGNHSRGFYPLEGELFFSAYGYDATTGTTSGYELWKTDGSTAGTVLVNDIYEGSGSSYPGNYSQGFYDLGGELFFSAQGYDATTSSASGYELWKTDGSTAGTVLVNDISEGSGSSYPGNNSRGFYPLGGELFFSANGYDATTGTSSGYELWKTDGSTAGTVLVNDIYEGSGSSSPGNYSQGFYDLGGELFFSAYGSDATTGTTSGYELWKTDGSTAGTVLVNDISEGSGSSYPGNHSRGFYYLGGELFFSAYGYDATTGTYSGVELWKTDGSTAGTVLVKDISEGSGSSSPGNYSQGFHDLGGKLFFSAYGYDATTGTSSGVELWKTDGSTAGTSLVKDLELRVSTNRYAKEFGGELFFSAQGYDATTGTTSGHELWKTDGSTAGTVLVKDIYEGSGSSYPGNHSRGFYDLGGELFFSAYGYDATTGTSSGYELWKTDGTTAGTVLVNDISEGSGSSSPGNHSRGFYPLEGELFFSAYGYDATTGTSSGYELWKTDGTTAGTVLVNDISEGSGSSYPGNHSQGFHALGGELFFSAQGYDATTGTSTGYELWKTDGTTAGTVLVNDIYQGSGSSVPGNHSRGFYDLGGELFFSAYGYDATTGTYSGDELWKTDGTTAGTVLVNDIYQGSGSSVPGNHSRGFYDLGGELFFSAYGYDATTGTTSGVELWKTDGTTAGTVLVNDIYQGSGSSVPGNNSQGFHALGGELFFSAQGYDATTGTYSGYELWKTDGTTAGTVLVNDISEGSGSSYPGNHSRGFYALGGELFFSAQGYDATTGTTSGVELWKTDGSTAGTVLVKDISEGSGSSSPGNYSQGFHDLGGKLFFSAYGYDATTGTSLGHELWKTDGTEEGTVSEQIVPGARSSYPDEFARLGNDLVFFAANGDLSGVDLRLITLNRPPVADAGPDVTLECIARYETEVSLDGAASFDPDDDALGFRWIFEGIEFSSDPTTILLLEPGIHTVILVVTDESGASHSDEVLVTIQDTTAPVLTLVGASELTLECSIDTYVESGATVTEACDPAVTVAIGGDTVDATVPGVYTVSYNVADASGNAAAEVSRTVTVRDTIPPVIALIGASELTLECSIDTYVESGATVTDACDSTVTVAIGGDTVDATVPGVYTVTYNVADASGNAAAEVSRTITVRDTTPPVIALIGASALTLECSLDTYAELAATVTDACDSTVTVAIGGDVVDTAVPGVYSVTYKATDSSGNAAVEVSRVVTVQDTTTPVITLLGADPLEHECATAFVDPGATATDTCAGNLTAAISVTGTVDTNTLGDYVLTYTVEDGHGNSATVTRTVTVIDTTLPVLTLVGADPLEHECATAFVDPGATATDTCAGNLTAAIIVTGTVDTSTLGNYLLTYTAEDGHGNSATLSRTVTVIDTTPPVLTLVGADPLEHECATAFVDPGATATDTCAGNLTAAIIVTGTVDTSTLGNYLLTYTVEDGHGNSATLSRTVTVIDTTPPVVTILSPDSGYVEAVDNDILFTAVIEEACDLQAVWVIRGFDEQETTLSANITTSSGGVHEVEDTFAFDATGIYSITLRATDDSDNQTEADVVTDANDEQLSAFVVIYDPNGGFVTGGGWIWSGEGALHPDLEAFADVTGKATFGFVAKYKKGANVPVGNTEFQFKAGQVNFKSTEYEWLVIAGKRAQYKGSGTINGVGNYKFMLTGIDGDLVGGDGNDRLRMKIWNDDGILYDNQHGTAVDGEIDDETIIGSGNVVIHKGK